jgi:glycosyltransferase involved in cell wall biosynthesis
MIQVLLDGRYSRVRLCHVRMAFSREMSDIGRASPGKLLHILGTLLRIVRARLRGARVLYYPPAGPDLVPVLRDLLLLIPTRWMFHSTVFHFHAGGLSEIYAKAPRWAHVILNAAYGTPDVAILLSNGSPPDGRVVRARQDVVIPNGIADSSGPPVPRQAAPPFRLLFVGVLRESKGVEILIEAVRLLREQGHDVALDLVGQPVSPEYATHLHALVTTAEITDSVVFHGVLTGTSKNAAFTSAHAFCFPSFFESENLPVVCIEAMVFGLPVVATRWRGLPDVVVDGRTGLLVDIRDAEGVATAVSRLVADPGFARELGRSGRARYEELYSVERFQRAIEEVLASAAG